MALNQIFSQKGLGEVCALMCYKLVEGWCSCHYLPHSFLSLSFPYISFIKYLRVLVCIICFIKLYETWPIFIGWMMQWVFMYASVGDPIYYQVCNSLQIIDKNCNSWFVCMNSKQNLPVDCQSLGVLPMDSRAGWHTGWWCWKTSYVNGLTNHGRYEGGGYTAWGISFGNIECRAVHWLYWVTKGGGSTQKDYRCHP